MSAVSMVKSHPKKMSKLFSYDSGRRNLKFEKMDPAITRKKWWGLITVEYLRST